MTNPLTESDLSEIEARCEAATPGKWFVYHADAGPTVQVPKGWVALLDWKCCGGTLDQRANATFIAAAREDVPRLVAEVRRLRGLIGKEAE